ncbi:MAG: MFS transporter [Parachlamydiaceae bacterium]|nr:MFS transporter [Parachlamydiaceae bacterium]
MQKTHIQPSLSQLFSACIGNIFEHYDTALFGFLSTFLAGFIFPQEDPITALILTYAMIPLGMLSRPLGALVFGYIGDTYGRQQALFLTLFGMSVVTGFIAFTPTYQQIGILSPIFFCLGRILQNFFSSGETMGGAIFLLENSSNQKHDLLSSLYNATTIAGILLASVGVTLLSSYDLIDQGWRFLYLIGCLTGVFGFVIRKKLPTKPIKTLNVKRESFLHFFKNCWKYKYPMMSIAIVSGFSYANYSIALIFMNGFIPLVSDVTKTEMMQVNTWLLILDLCTLPLFGWLSSKYSREKIMLVSSLAVVCSGVPLLMTLVNASLLGIIGVRICLVLLGAAFFAPFHAWALQLIPVKDRYGIISFAYAIGAQILGGPAAAISLWLYKKTGIVSSVSWYWVFLATLSSFCIVKTMKLLQKNFVYSSS